MSPSKPDPRTCLKALDGRQNARRCFLGGVLGLVGGFAAFTMLPRQEDRRALSVHEADYYKPHDHVG